jgi:hypothetical protein
VGLKACPGQASHRKGEQRGFLGFIVVGYEAAAAAAAPTADFDGVCCWEVGMHLKKEVGSVDSVPVLSFIHMSNISSNSRSLAAYQGRLWMRH